MDVNDVKPVLAEEPRDGARLGKYFRFNVKFCRLFRSF